MCPLKNNNNSLINLILIVFIREYCGGKFLQHIFKFMKNIFLHLGLERIHSRIPVIMLHSSPVLGKTNSSVFHEIFLLIFYNIYKCVEDTKLVRRFPDKDFHGPVQRNHHVACTLFILICWSVFNGTTCQQVTCWLYAYR